jgi:hypothetical protein
LSFHKIHVSLQQDTREPDASAWEDQMTPSEEHGTRHPDRLADKNDLQVLVGWTHRLMASGLDLRLQTTRSRVALENDQVESSHVLMTRSQALMLAKYLLDVTEQSLPAKARRRFWGGVKKT